MKLSPVMQLIKELRAMTELEVLLTPDTIAGLRIAIEQAEHKLVLERWELEKVYRAGRLNSTNDGSELAAELYVGAMYAKKLPA